MNRSVTGAFDLTPSTAYSCKTSWGELSFDPNAKDANNITVPTLTIHGTVFIDGNARIAPSSKPLIRVVGVGTIYVAGSMVVAGTNVCAAYSGSSCDWAKPGAGHWDVTHNFLAIVAGVVGGGGQLETTDSSVSISAFSTTTTVDAPAFEGSSARKQTKSCLPVSIEAALAIASTSRSSLTHQTYFFVKACLRVDI